MDVVCICLSCLVDHAKSDVFYHPIGTGICHLCNKYSLTIYEVERQNLLLNDDDRIRHKYQMCKCGNPSGQSYYDYDYHGWFCRNCDKPLSIVKIEQ